MERKRRFSNLLFAILGSFLILGVYALNTFSAPEDEARQRLQAKQLRTQGNWKEALEIFRQLAERSDSNPEKVDEDLSDTLQCLAHLGKTEDADDVLAKVVGAHASNPSVLQKAAREILNLPHYGIVLANTFHRAPRQHDGTGVWVDVTELDRNQALRWLERSLELVRSKGDQSFAANWGRNLAEAILHGRQGRQAWKLQDKTDLTKELTYNTVDQDGQQGIVRYAPVKEDGLPVLYSSPTQYSDAKSDGERLRWAIEQWAISSPSEARLFWADFLNAQFGVSTLAENRWFHRLPAHETSQVGGSNKDPAATGVYAIHTLSDDEAIAHLASGVKRFSLEDAYNPIKIWRSLIASYPHSTDAYQRLVIEYNNRRQYTKAADVCRLAIKADLGSTDWFAKQLASIEEPRGRFEPVPSQVAGSPAQVNLIYRNAKQAQFTAQRVDVEKLLSDTKQFYRSVRPGVQPPVFGGRRNRTPPSITQPHELFNKIKVDDYVLEKTAEWKLDLAPLENHWERRVQVATPLQQTGLYLVTTQLANSAFYARCLVWINDTAIVKKQLNNEVLYQIADARTGLPLADTNVEFFGFAHDYSENGRPKPFKIANFAKKSTADGSVILNAKELGENFQWSVTARTKHGSLATLGMEHLWLSQFYPQTFEQLKAYGVSDRPAYRPGETIKAKIWVALARYGSESNAPAQPPSVGQNYSVALMGPDGTSLWQGKIELDRYGGAALEFAIPKDAKLGAYRFQVQDGNIATDFTIRIEEYRKPEFEVFVDAPAEPVQLGDKFSAKVRAKYYFGTPVSGAKATIKVTRSAFDDHYFPVRPFDWCYGPGYWWTTYDTPWYPGWTRWVGCRRPSPWWIPFSPEEPPELVYEQEVVLDDAGEASFEIDTALAKEFQSDQDHRYRIAVDVRDASRRTLSASGEVVAARQAFKIYSWNDRGYYRTGEKLVATFHARTLNGKPVIARGKIDLLRITYDPQRAPIETLVQTFDVASNAEGEVKQTLETGRSGQYRLRIMLADDQEHTIEGGCLFTVRGGEASGADFRYSALELIPDKSEYKPGEKIRLQINADRDDALVAVFLRPQGSVYAKPQWVRLQAKSSTLEIPVSDADQPNFFIEAFTIYDGAFHEETREIFVPPQERILDVTVKSDKAEYLPGEEAEVTIEVKDLNGEPIESSAVLAVYDRALDQIAPDAIPSDIREFFWKWRRSHHPQSSQNLSLITWAIGLEGMPNAAPLGIFGHSMADDADSIKDMQTLGGMVRGRLQRNGFGGMAPTAAPMSAAESAMDGVAPLADSRRSLAATPPMGKAVRENLQAEGEGIGENAKLPTLRKDFADAAFWKADLRGDRTGMSKVRFKMPENLTSWQIAVWSMGDGVRVGSSKIQALTRKNLMVRLQAPRFLVDRDQVILSALVNNDFDEAVDVDVTLKQEGGFVELVEPQRATQSVQVPAHSQRRVDWKCRAVRSGEAIFSVAAISARESDAMQLKLPVIVNGILKTESFAGTVRATQDTATIEFEVPEARLVDQSLLTVRVSPSLAMAMVDALPFMVDYPHGCTEQTLNRFVPTVVVQHTLRQMKIDLESLSGVRNNLNAQELGDPAKRVQRWKKFDRNPVFDNQEVSKMVDVGLRRLTEMQNSDGGWGWFSGYGEQSWPHTTAVVVRGLMVAQHADAAIVPDCLQRGLEWLRRYQAEQLKLLQNSATKTKPYKTSVDDLDALVFHILVMADSPSDAMQAFLYEQRNQLSVHAKGLLALAVHRRGNIEQTQMLRRNIEQFLVQDLENETAYLSDESPWWYWYGSRIESTAVYLQLMTRLEPKGEVAPRLVKYLLNNRKHAVYWNSTRDTAQVLEAFAEYIQASGEATADLQADVLLDGQSIGRVRITAETLFTANTTLELVGAEIKPGKHKLELRRSGASPMYWNVYQTNFTLEDEIKPAGLEIKVDRKYYRIDSVKRDMLKAGDLGQIADGQRAGFERVPLHDLVELKSGQVVEVELLIESKNDYEYIMIQDPKAASMEPIETASGYQFSGGLSVYREFRDQFVGLFLRQVPRGTHSISYRMRCEAPGRFTALPTTAVGMYAPELVGNSADFDLSIVDE